MSWKVIVAILLGIGLLYLLWKRGVFREELRGPFGVSPIEWTTEPSVAEVRGTLRRSVREMEARGREAGVPFVQPYTEPSLVGQALRYERLAEAYRRR